MIAKRRCAHSVGFHWKTNRILAAGALLVTMRAFALEPGQPLGPELRLNPDRADGQFGASVAADGQGGWMVVWSKYTDDNSEYDVYGRHVTAGGIPAQEEFRINDETAGSQVEARVVSDRNGNFLVVWEDSAPDRLPRIVGKRISANGVAVGEEFLIGGDRSGWTNIPFSIAVLPDGEFLAAWNIQLDGQSRQVFTRRFDSQDNPLGPEYLVSGQDVGNNGRPCLTSKPDGGFIVGWPNSGMNFSGSTGSPRPNGLRVRSLDLNGAPTSESMRVGNTTERVATCRLVTAPSGRFLIVWDEIRNGTGNVFQLWFESEPCCTEVVVNDPDYGGSGTPYVAIDARGGYVVAWYKSETEPGAADNKIMARRFDTSGAPLANPFVVNQEVRSYKGFPSVATDSDGDFAIAWSDRNADFPGGAPVVDIFLRRFVGPEAVDLAVTAEASPEIVESGGSFDILAEVSNLHAPASEPASDIGYGSGVTVSANLTDGATFTGSESPGWRCQATSSEIVCTLLSALKPGDKKQLRLQALAPSAADSSLATVRVDGGQVDPNNANNVASREVGYNAPPTASPSPGPSPSPTPGNGSVDGDSGGGGATSPLALLMLLLLGRSKLRPT